MNLLHLPGTDHLLTVGRIFPLAVALAIGSATTFTACANSGEDSPSTAAIPDATTPLDGASANDAAPPPPCDVREPECRIEVPCSEADWCPVETPVDPQYALTAIWGSGASDVWATGAGGIIAHWDGGSWSMTPSGTTHILNAIWGSGPHDIWTVSSSDLILHSDGFEGGTAIWERVPKAYRSVIPIHSVWGPSGGSEVIVGGSIHRAFQGIPLWTSERETVSWSYYPGSPRLMAGVTINGLWGSRAGDLWFVGVFETSLGDREAGGVAYHREVSDADGGSEPFVRTDVAARNPLEAIWGSADDDIWTVGTHGTIRHFAGDGIRWQSVEAPTSRNLHAVWGTGPDDAWVVGDEGTLLHWDGTKWSATVASLPAGPKPNFYGVWGSGPEDVWAVGENGTILHFTGRKTSPEGDAR